MKRIELTIFTTILLMTLAQAGLAQVLPTITDAEVQPVLAQALRVGEALEYIGSPLLDVDSDRLESLADLAHEESTLLRIQEVLDPYVLAYVEINAEGRVKVERGPATALMMQEGWTNYLIKVNNGAGVRERLTAESPNAEPSFHKSSNDAQMRPENAITPGQLDNRFIEAKIFGGRPLQKELTGISLEYAVLQIFSKVKGQRMVNLGFNAGQGSQDIGFRNTIDILFDSRPAVKVKLGVEDHDGEPTMASFVFTDKVDRVDQRSREGEWSEHYRDRIASNNFGDGEDRIQKLTGIYPLPSRRQAMRDDFPDFFFQPQIYRADEEYVLLPPGEFQVVYTRGPEYISQEKTIQVPEGVDSLEVDFKLQRWIDMASLNWFSGDHHIHAAGCSHYESPEEGVKPEDMFRQIRGEDLNIGASLAWGPCWYYQKEFFTGKIDPSSTSENILRNDVEISGFPSAHAGHIVLLGVSEDDYPGTSKIEEWPSYTVPILSWAQKQGALVGYAHSGWGLEPEVPTTDLPNYEMPKLNGIGANEFIVSVALGNVDFYSLGDTPAPWELNMWYHSLNSGFDVRISGETDFPCIYDERVGLARSYVQVDGELSYERYLDSIKRGRSYVTEGRSHIIDFKVDGEEVGVEDSRVSLSGPAKVKVTARVNAMLDEVQSEAGSFIAGRSLTEQPYWHIERARLGESRDVEVELVVNGDSVDRTKISADGSWNDLSFEYEIEESSWMSLRIYPSSHTNPMWVEVEEKPVSVTESVEWANKAVDKCWEMKEDLIRDDDKVAAKSDYQRARDVYESILGK